MANIIDVNYNVEEYMAERQTQAQEQELRIKYDRFQRIVWIEDLRSGEGGIFNMFEFLCADDPRKFFADNF